MHFISKIEKMPSSLKILLLIVIDFFMVMIGYYFALIFEDIKFDLFNPPIRNTIIVTSGIYIALLYIFGSYKKIIKYSGTNDYLMIGGMAIISAAFVSFIKPLVVPRTLDINVIMLACIFSGILSIAIRVLFRAILYAISNDGNTNKKRVLIIGAGGATSQIIKTIQMSSSNEYLIVGIIDDDPNKKSFSMHGIKILGNREMIPEICETEKVDLILFSINNIRPQEKNKILKICDSTNAKVKIVQPLEQAIIGKSINDSLRDVEVEDLLGREPIVLDNKEISKYLMGKVVLVTGAGGSIGSELCRQILKFNPKKLVMLDIYENTLYEIEMELKQKRKNAPIETIIASVRDLKRMDEIFDKYRPQIVFHAAAHKHVPLMENSAEEAIKNNVFGTYNVAKCSDKYGVEKFTFISTDKAVNPTSIMGASKRICEMIIQSMNENSNTIFTAVRFGNVLGSHGSVIPLFKKQIEDGGPVTVTHKEITRFFMLIPEAVGLILQSVTFANNGEIFVLDMGEPVKIYDLAKTLIKLSGKKVPIEIVGLRKGEKLYEELLMSEEGLIKTLHDKIMISKIKGPSESEMENILNKFRELLERNNCSRDEIKSVIKEVVPTFIDLEEK